MSEMDIIMEERKGNLDRLFQLLSSSLLAQVFCFLNERDHCRFGRTCKRAQHVSCLDHSWGSLLIGSAHLPGCRFDDPLRLFMCRKVRQQQEDKRDSDDSSIDDPSLLRCDFCSSVLRFWDRLENARPLEVVVQWRDPRDFVRLPRRDRLRKLTLRRCSAPSLLPWIAQMPRLEEFVLRVDDCSFAFGEFGHDRQVSASQLLVALVSLPRLHTLRVPDVQFENKDVVALVHSGLAVTDLALTCTRDAVPLLPRLPLVALHLRHPVAPLGFAPLGGNEKEDNTDKAEDDAAVLATLASMSLQKLDYFARCTAQGVECAKFAFPLLLELRALANVVRVIEAPRLTTLAADSYLCADDIRAFPALTALDVQGYGTNQDAWWPLLQERGIRKLGMTLEEHQLQRLCELPALQEADIRCSRGDFAVIADVIAQLSRRNVRIPCIYFQNGPGLNDATLGRLAPSLQGQLRAIEVGEWSNLSPGRLVQHFGRLDVHILHENCEHSDITLCEFMCPDDANRTFWESSGLSEDHRVGD